jgi:hypothetical protein
MTHNQQTASMLDAWGASVPAVVMLVTCDYCKGTSRSLRTREQLQARGWTVVEDATGQRDRCADCAWMGAGDA